MLSLLSPTTGPGSFLWMMAAFFAVLVATDKIELDFSQSSQVANVTTLTRDVEASTQNLAKVRPDVPNWAPADRPDGRMEVLDAAPMMLGHYQFCESTAAKPDDCRHQPSAAEFVTLTGRNWSIMNKVNSDVNREYIPGFDIDVYGEEEFWNYPTFDGADCEDYVLEKRRRLIDNFGWPPSSLLITHVRQIGVVGPDGRVTNLDHAVLTVVTDRGDLVLDNMTNEIRGWQSTRYEFLQRVDQHHSGKWVYLWDPRFELAD